MPAPHHKKRPAAPPAHHTTGPTDGAAADPGMTRDDDANDWMSERLVRPDPADRQDIGIGHTHDGDLHGGRAIESKRGQQ